MNAADQMVVWAKTANKPLSFDYVLVMRAYIMDCIIADIAYLMSTRNSVMVRIHICSSWSIDNERAVYFLKSNSRDGILPSRHMQSADVVIKFADGEPRYIKDRRNNLAVYNHKVMFRSDLDEWCTFFEISTYNMKVCTYDRFKPNN